MNGQVENSVKEPVFRSRFVTAMTLAVGLTTAGACTQVQGGAVEFSWSLLTFGGEFVQNSCVESDITTVRLSWEAEDTLGTGAPDGFKDFQCIAGRGVTEFEIEEGRQLLWLTPICSDGEPADPGTFEVPPPIVRQVREGEVVTLNSLLIVFEYDDPDDNVAGCLQTDTPCTCD